MTPQELKNSILQLAIQGRLAPQRPEEGTAEELYRQIQREKAALVKAGKIRKEKPLPEITEEEVPFEIPEGWKWCYVGDIFQHNTGKALNASDKQGTPLTYITTSNLYWNRFELDNLKSMLFTDADIEKCTVNKGDLLVCEGGDFGRAAIWPYDEQIRIQNHIHRLRPYSEVNIDYYYYVFYLYKNAGWISGKGIGIQGLSSKALHVLRVPLPPLAEQKRIVAKIEELLPYIDRYEKAWSRLEDFNKRFPTDMQKSIFQLAIQGKLVPQRPEEGTGEALYQRIQAEKQSLIRSGQLKKEKNLPEITPDEIPFDIPESWKWVRLNTIAIIRGGKRMPKGEKLSLMPTKHIYIRVTDMRDGTILDNDLHYVPDNVYPIISQYIIKESDVYIVIVGSTIGKVGLVPSKFDGMNLTENAARLSPVLIDKRYLYYLLSANSIQNQFMDKTKQVGQPKLALFRLESTCLPLPPLAEQKRIVAKLEELLPLCDRLR